MAYEPARGTETVEYAAEVGKGQRVTVKVTTQDGETVGASVMAEAGTTISDADLSRLDFSKFTKKARAEARRAAREE